MAQTDRDALLALYRLTDGASWKIKTNWNTDAALSQCHGVEISRESRLVKLSLGNNNLRGI